MAAADPWALGIFLMELDEATEQNTIYSDSDTEFPCMFPGRETGSGIFSPSFLYKCPYGSRNH